MSRARFISPLGRPCTLIREGEDYLAFMYDDDVGGGFALSRGNLKIMRRVL